MLEYIILHLSQKDSVRFDADELFVFETSEVKSSYGRYYRKLDVKKEIEGFTLVVPNISGTFMRGGVDPEAIDSEWELCGTARLESKDVFKITVVFKDGTKDVLDVAQDIYPKDLFVHGGQDFQVGFYTQEDMFFFWSEAGKYKSTVKWQSTEPVFLRKPKAS